MWRLRKQYCDWKSYPGLTISSYCEDSSFCLQATTPRDGNCPQGKGRNWKSHHPIIPSLWVSLCGGVIPGWHVTWFPEWPPAGVAASQVNVYTIDNKIDKEADHLFIVPPFSVNVFMHFPQTLTKLALQILKLFQLFHEHVFPCTSQSSRVSTNPYPTHYDSHPAMLGFLLSCDHEVQSPIRTLIHLIFVSALPEQLPRPVGLPVLVSLPSLQ